MRLSFKKEETRRAIISAAVDLMTERKIGAVLIAENGKLAGIFTERDVLHRVVKSRRDLEKTALSEVMTANPQCVAPSDPALAALQIMSDDLATALSF